LQSPKLQFPIVIGTKPLNYEHKILMLKHWIAIKS
jgi:hypothetical protein